MSIYEFSSLLNNNRNFAITVVSIIYFIIPVIIFLITKIFKNVLKKYNNVKILILKIMIVLGIFNLILAGIAKIFFNFYFPLFMILFALFGVVSFTFAIFSEITNPKASKYKIKDYNYDDFSRKMENKLTNNDYQNIYKDKENVIYKCLKKYNDNLYIIEMRFNELEKSEYDRRINKLIKYITLNYCSNNGVFRLIIVLCVDKKNYEFDCFCNNNQTIGKSSILSVGISFGSRKAYIANDALSSISLMRLKKEIIKILDLKNN